MAWRSAAWLAVLGAIGFGACVLDRDGAYEAPEGATVAQNSAAPSSASVTTSGPGGSNSTSSSTGGAGGVAPGCGDGAIDQGEICDDGNITSGDGCDSSCHIESGYECEGIPSVCVKIPPVVVSSATTTIAIPDNGYNGNVNTMTCRTLMVTTPYTSIQEVQVTYAVSHSYIGDLTMKVMSPANVVTTLMSRPGMMESNDNGADCLSLPCDMWSEYGDASNLATGSPITFLDSAAADAEVMGLGLLASGVVCQDDALCEYVPNSGAGPGMGLSDFNGADPNGNWLVCVGDGSPNAIGDLGQVTISILAF